MQSEFTPTALIVLLSLIPMTVYVSWAKRPQNAVLWVAFFGALFGPEGAFLKFPLLPVLDKFNIPYLLLMIMALARCQTRFKRARPFRGVEVLTLVGLFAAGITGLTNMDELTYGSWVTVTKPAMSLKDGIQMGLGEFFTAGLPFILGRTLFRTRRDLIQILHFLVVASLIQGLFMLVEMRLGPTFHYRVYGYAAHPDFTQSMRWGGFRPNVFTIHGLAIAMFTLAAFFSAILLAKRGHPIRKKWRASRAAIFIAFLVFWVCKSSGIIIYSVLLVPLLWRGKLTTQLRVASILVIIVAVYPTARALDLVPTERLTATAESLLNPDRAQSLSFRFDNEGMLLDKARERMLFGWGSYGRRSVYDDEMGQEIAIADGHWIIVLGSRGLIGFFASFGLLIFPVLLVKRRLKYFRDPEDQRLIIGFAMIIAICTFDLVPNGLFSNWIYLLAGALLGMTQEAKRFPGSWNR